jgi:hypothetical protein
LTSDDIIRWQTEMQEAEAAKAKADEIIADRRKKLDAATLLSGVVFATNVTFESGEQESMRAAVERILAAFDRPVHHHELQSELRKVLRFREMLDKHKGSYYYTLIKRLADDRKIKKIGKKIRLIHKNETPPEETLGGAS